MPKTSIFNSLFDQATTQLELLSLDIKNGRLRFTENEINNVARVIFSKLNQGGISTFVISENITWNPESFYFESCREAAKRGCKIDRTFLLPHRLYVHHKLLQRQKCLDEAAGINVKVMLVKENKIDFNKFRIGLDFGIWDDEIVCTNIAYSGWRRRGGDTWNVSNTRSDIEKFRDLWIELHENGELIDYTSNINNDSIDLEEPMIYTAPMMDFLASTLCAEGLLDNHDCSWYHGFWQYLRIFDLVSTPSWHSKFYQDRILEFLLDMDYEGRFLVSGTADYSVLAYLIWACKKAKKSARITVIDICQTPLLICQWYGRQQGFSIKVLNKNILDFEDSEKFDLIISDAFITRFEENLQNSVLGKWNDLLAEKGRVITTVRANEIEVGKTVPVKAEEIEEFVSNAYGQAVLWQDFIKIQPEEAEARARIYAQKIKSHIAGSSDDVRNLFARNEFQFCYFETVEVKGEMKVSHYARIVAKKHDKM